MRGEASLSADRESRDSLAPKLRESGQEAWNIGEELFVVTALLDRDMQVSRSLTDPSRPKADKVRLLQGILADEVHPVTLEILSHLVGYRWSRVRDIANAVEDFAVDAMMYYADAVGSTLRVSVELAQIQSLMLMMPVLQSKLCDDSAPAKARLDLLHATMPKNSVDSIVMRLVEHAVANPRHRSLTDTLQWLIAKFSRHMGESMVTVTTAVALSKEQIQRLVDIYSAKLGQHVHINSVVDPSVIGGMRVQVGAEVTDNTVVAQLKQLKRSMQTQM